MQDDSVVTADFVPVVVGGDIGAYALGRELHEAFGVTSVCVAPAPIGAIAHSRIFTVHPIAALDASSLRAALVEIASDARVRGTSVFVISNAEPVIPTLATLACEMPDNVVMCVPDPATVALLANKLEFSRLCQEHGLDVARTEAVRLADGDAIAPTGIDFPLVVKPAYSPEYASCIAAGFQKVYYLHEQAELDRLLRDLRAAGFGGTMLVQELIAGDDTYMDSITIYVNRAGEACLFASARVLLEDHAPTMLGNPVAMITQQAGELWDRASALLASVGYRGFANFDVKRDPTTGRHVFFEVNTRIGRNSYYVCAGGVNPMRVAVDDLVHGTQHGPLVADRKILYTLVPLSLLRSYVRDGALLAELDALVSAGLVFDPQRYEADRGLRRMIDVELTERNQVRKFARYYPEPTDSSF